jgi:hypothetical protein
VSSAAVAVAVSALALRGASTPASTMTLLVAVRPSGQRASTMCAPSSTVARAGAGPTE